MPFASDWCDDLDDDTTTDKTASDRDIGQMMGGGDVGGCHCKDCTIELHRTAVAVYLSMLCNQVHGYTLVQEAILLEGNHGRTRSE